MRSESPNTELANPLSRLEKAALRLHEILWNNTGTSHEWPSDEWPIAIKVDDDLIDAFIAALNELSNAVAEVDHNATSWPNPWRTKL